MLPGSEASPSATEKGLVSGAMVVQEADNDAGKAEGRVYYPLNLGDFHVQLTERCHRRNSW